MSPIQGLSTSQAVDLSLAAFRYGIDSLVPAFILESFCFGLMSIAFLIGAYILLVSNRWNRNTALQILAITCAYAVMAAHWGMERQSIRDLLSGSVLALSAPSNSDSINFTKTLQVEAFVLDNLLPLITETVLFSISSFLFVVACYILRRHTVLNVHSGQTVLTCCMYLIALLHWAIEVATYRSAYGTLDNTSDNSQAPFETIGRFHNTAPLVLLSINIVMSDMIVLWRVIILWENRVDILVTAGSLIFLTAGLTIANLVVVLGADKPSLLNMFTPDYFAESLTTGMQRGNFFGLLALAASLGSNAIATCLVAFKAWKHRQKILDQFRVGSPRSMAERLMGLLVESGAVYCVIWVLYITTNLVPVAADGVPGLHVVDHLNVFMAQLTSIYPTLIILLVALERSYCDRQLICNIPQHVAMQPVSVNVVVDITSSSSPPLHPPIQLSQTLDDFGTDSHRDSDVQRKEKEAV